MLASYERWRHRLRKKGEMLYSYAGPVVPDHIQDLLDKAAADSGPFGKRASVQGWEESLYAPTADGSQVLNTTTETIMIPDFTLPANYMVQGRMLKYTLLGDISTVVTTPGTIIPSLRWGGVAGTVMAVGTAWTPKVTATTTFSYMVEWYIIARAAPSATAASFTMGRQTSNAMDGTSAATLLNYMNSGLIPQSAPAAVNIASNAANAITPTIKFSVATATTQFTNHIALLESLN